MIFDGGTGTISEFGMAWGLAKLYFGHHKPLILYGKFWENIMQAFKDNMILRPEELEVYKIVESVDGVLQAVSDFEHELQMSLMNRRLDTHIETVFMMPSEEYSFLSSKVLKEVAFLKGDIRGMVPTVVVKGLKRKFKNKT